ncbi:MAG: CDP-alcohol phosphatidyltransferase family protein [Phycisphaerales bacterium]|nr:CDP-alcohol phosphatidyltransferase family protein [Phycisphaerales bacterium]
MKINDYDQSKGRRARRRERVLKTVAVLPSLATLGNLTCGVGAVYLCLLSVQAGGSDLNTETMGSARINSLFPTFLSIAAYLLIAAMFFDGLDGRLARLTRKTSEFGGQLDSMSDMVSFGVAPAFLVICIAQPATFSEISSLPPWVRAYWRAEWVMVAVFVCCAALRLARFNVENEEDESSHMDFRGLPTPGAAGAIIGLVIFHQSLLPELAHEKAVEVLAALLPPFALVAGLLMVSPFRYAHLVNSILRGRRPFWQVVSIVIIVLIGLVVEFRLTLAIASAAYALSGPVASGIYKILGRRQPEESLLPDSESDMVDAQETFDEADENEPGADEADSVRITG